jgi:outer membrane protein OmpA-like peptidoglycan-associated protein
MKTNQLKIAAFVMAALFCLTTYPASAHRYSRHAYRKMHYARKKTSPAVLANMKIKNVQFGFNKTDVPESAHETLDHVAKLMTDNNASLKLGGYADNKGGYVYNWKLSKVRADAVKAYLVSKGADSSRIAATEFGYTHPIASNATPTGRKKNRRVEIHFAE